MKKISRINKLSQRWLWLSRNLIPICPRFKQFWPFLETYCKDTSLNFKTEKPYFIFIILLIIEIINLWLTSFINVSKAFLNVLSVIKKNNVCEHSFAMKTAYGSITVTQKSFTITIVLFFEESFHLLSDDACLCSPVSFIELNYK